MELLRSCLALRRCSLLKAQKVERHVSLSKRSSHARKPCSFLIPSMIHNPYGKRTSKPASNSRNARP
jgi:hypothetical protein